MLKRTISLLAAIAILVTAAPTAEACFRCKHTIDGSYCIPTTWGRTDCVDDEFGYCQLYGGNCSEAGPDPAAFAAEYQVASVERIDEAPAADEALVAKLEASQPAAESVR
jgi:hypothetical protein